MLVVNRGISGDFHIFRGSDAQVFLGGLRVVTSDRVTVRDPRGGRISGRVFTTTSGTLAVVFNYEFFSDAGAKLIFRRVEKKVTGGLSTHA